MQNLVDFLVKLIVVWIGDVAHVEDQSSFLHFFESGAKCRKQPFGQVADKPYGIGNQHTTVRGKTQRTDRGIKCGKHPRRNQHFRAAQGIEQRGLACVGVTHQRDGAKRDGIAGFTAQRPLLANFINADLDFADAVANPAPVGLQFLFAGSAHADASGSAARSPSATSTALTAEARHRGSLSRQAGKHVIQLRQLDLQLAFTAPRMPRENVENQLCAVDHVAFGGFFNVALLHGRKIAVENDQRRTVCRVFGANFIQLTAADERSRIGGIAHLEDGSGDLRACAARQLNEFCERRAALLARRHARKSRRTFPANAYQQGAFCIRNLMLCFRH